MLVLLFLDIIMCYSDNQLHYENTNIINSYNLYYVK